MHERFLADMKKIIFIFLVCVIASGCGNNKDARVEYEVEVPSYEKKQSEEYIVTRGDIEQKIKLELKAKDVERVSYFSSAEPMKIEEKTELVVVMYGEGLGPLGTGS